MNSEAMVEAASSSPFVQGIKEAYMELMDGEMSYHEQ